MTGKTHVEGWLRLSAQSCAQRMLFLINFNKNKGMNTRNFPFLSLVPNDYTSCFSKSPPDIGTLLLSNLVIAPLLSGVSQRGCPCARACARRLSPAGSLPPQVIPLFRTSVLPPPLCLETCVGDMSHRPVLPG